MIAMVLAIIIILGIGLVLADSQRSWNVMYNRIYSDVATESYVARKTFDSVIRKASRNKLLLDDNGTWIEVYSYQDADSPAVDRYTRFYYEDNENGGQLKVEYGNWNPSEENPRDVERIQTVCSNVSSCVFTVAGRSVQMIITLDNGSQTATIVSSAVMHNQ